jgi:hypothetical protein
VISGDGTTVIFSSHAANLVTGDTNGRLDYFAHDMHAEPPVAYCIAGTSTQGCTATMSTTGAPSGSAGSGFVITASGVDGQRPAIMLYGISGRASVPWGASTLCVAAPRQRTALQSSGGASGLCNGSIALDWNAFLATHATALGVPLVAMTPTTAQVWIRDPQATKHSVLSDAIEFYACP